MKTTVTIEKSFDDTRVFGKNYEDGDFEKFFGGLKGEGKYIDRLCKIVETHGEEGDEFTVSYIIRVTK